MTLAAITVYDALLSPGFPFALSFKTIKKNYPAGTFCNKKAFKSLSIQSGWFSMVKVMMNLKAK